MPAARLVPGRGARVWCGSMAASGMMERRERVLVLPLRLDRPLELPPSGQGQSLKARSFSLCFFISRKQPVADPGG